MKEADTFSSRHAEDYFHFIRLNSSKESVQRTLGAIFKDDAENTLLFASDHDTLEHSSFDMAEERTEKISRNSTGVFKGVLSDVDDRNKFVCIYEAKEPSFYFQKLDEMYVFCGQRGELALSFDGGNNWKSEKLSSTLIRYRGSTGQYYYFDSCIIKRK